MVVMIFCYFLLQLFLYKKIVVVFIFWDINREKDVSLLAKDDLNEKIEYIREW